MEGKEEGREQLTLARLLELVGLYDADVLNVYLFGSRLWGPLPWSK